MIDRISLWICRNYNTKFTLRFLKGNLI